MGGLKLRDDSYLAFEVVVSGKEQATRDGCGDGGDAAQNGFGLDQLSGLGLGGGRRCEGSTYAVEVQFAVGADIK